LAEKIKEMALMRGWGETGEFPCLISGLVKVYLIYRIMWIRIM
jgi:hypothetical protein